MRIALLVSGEPRFSYQAGSLFRNLDTKGATIDVFIHAWDSINETLVDPDFSSWKPILHEMSNKDDIFNPILEKVQSLGLIPRHPNLQFLNPVEKLGFQKIFGQLLSHSRVIDLFRPYSTSYDMAIRTRHDLMFDTNFMGHVNEFLQFRDHAAITFSNDREMDIFSGGATYRNGVMLIGDCIFIATPNAFMHQTKNIEQAILDICCALPHLFGLDESIQHRAWTLLSELNKVNLIPISAGNSWATPWPRRYSIMRPGVEKFGENLTYQQAIECHINHHLLNGSGGLTP